MIFFPHFVTNVSILFEYTCIRIDTTRDLMLYALDYKGGQDKD